MSLGGEFGGELGGELGGDTVDLNLKAREAITSAIESINDKFGYYWDQKASLKNDGVMNLTTNIKDAQDAILGSMTSMCQTFMEIVKCLLGALNFPLDDQMNLFMNCVKEMTILYMAYRFDMQTNSISFYWNPLSFLRESFVKVGFGEYIDDILQLGRFVNNMMIDRQELIFLVALSVFTGGSVLHGITKVCINRILPLIRSQFEKYVSNKYGFEALQRIFELNSILFKLQMISKTMHLALSKQNVAFVPKLFKQIWCLKPNLSIPSKL